MRPHLCLQASWSLSCHDPALHYRCPQKGARLARRVCCFCRQYAIFTRHAIRWLTAVLVLALQVALAVFCSRVCEAEGCGTRSSSNYPGEKGRRFCAKHRLPGMVRTCWRGASAQARWLWLMHLPGPPRSLSSTRIQALNLS